MTGPQLREARRAGSVRAIDVARRMGVSRQRITNLERQPEPEPATISRYLAALSGATAERAA